MSELTAAEAITRDKFEEVVGNVKELAQLFHPGIYCSYTKERKIGSGERYLSIVLNTENIDNGNPLPDGVKENIKTQLFADIESAFAKAGMDIKILRGDEYDYQSSDMPFNFLENEKLEAVSTELKRMKSEKKDMNTLEKNSQLSGLSPESQEFVMSGMKKQLKIRQESASSVFSPEALKAIMRTMGGIKE